LILGFCQLQLSPYARRTKLQYTRGSAFVNFINLTDAQSQPEITSMIKDQYQLPKFKPFKVSTSYAEAAISSARCSLRPNPFRDTPLFHTVSPLIRLRVRSARSRSAQLSLSTARLPRGVGAAS